MITLAIEAAIAGGSISLIRDGDEIAHWIGTGSVSKAENLLADIDRLMRENNIDRSDIGLIAVSAGPGSFTGIRIGIATAIGIKNGLGVEMTSVSALEAMVFASGLIGQVTATVPVGRGSVCIQEFDGGKPSGPPQVVAEEELPDRVRGTLLDVDRLGMNLAYAVGLLANVRRTVVEPIFLSKGG
jgi:tRNA threonylcarbamoyladenosine biosynthesis protein TsaB